MHSAGCWRGQASGSRCSETVEASGGGDWGGHERLEAGWPLHAVRAFFGHANVTTTSRYLDVKDDYLQELTERQPLTLVKSQEECILGIGQSAACCLSPPARVSTSKAPSVDLWFSAPASTGHTASTVDQTFRLNTILVLVGSAVAVSMTNFSPSQEALDMLFAFRLSLPSSLYTLVVFRFPGSSIAIVAAS
jgi:hypothetical protein